MNETVTIRGLDNEGFEWFYTGKAGSGWISRNKADAFTGYSLEGARRKATIFNKNTALHGLWFVAIRQYSFA